MEILEFLKKLEELGVTFCVSVPHQGGSETHISKPEELISLIKDPIAIYAKHYGVTKDQYLAWASEDFSAHCAGKTSKGAQCKNTVKGGSLISPKKWVELQEEYCAVHGEGREP